MNQHQTVSIVIPVYNERPTIEILLDQVRAADTLGLKKEIILVDDSSTDGTTDFLRSLNEPDLKVFIHEKNQGKGGGLHTGFAQASGDIVVVQDADLEYDPSEIHKVLKPFMESDIKVVYGSRYLNPTEGLAFWHSFFNRMFTEVSNILLRQRITDIMTCYKAFHRPVLMDILPSLESKRFGFEPEVTAKVSRKNIKIKEVPVSYNPRSLAEGKHMNFKGQLESLWALVKYSLVK